MTPADTLAAITAVGLAIIIGPRTRVDPIVAYQLAVIDVERPEIATLEASLRLRGWREDDIGSSLLWRLDRARMAVHIAEERLLELYGMPRLSTATAPDVEPRTCESCDRPGDADKFQAYERDEVDDYVCDECLAVQQETADWDRCNADAYRYR